MSAPTIAGEWPRLPATPGPNAYRPPRRRGSQSRPPRADISSSRKGGFVGTEGSALDKVIGLAAKGERHPGPVPPRGDFARDARPYRGLTRRSAPHYSFGDSATPTGRLSTSGAPAWTPHCWTPQDLGAPSAPFGAFPHDSPFDAPFRGRIATRKQAGILIRNLRVRTPNYVVCDNSGGFGGAAQPLVAGAAAFGSGLAPSGTPRRVALKPSAPAGSAGRRPASARTSAATSTSSGDGGIRAAGAHMLPPYQPPHMPPWRSDLSPELLQPPQRTPSAPPSARSHARSHVLFGGRGGVVKPYESLVISRHLLDDESGEAAHQLDGLFAACDADGDGQLGEAEAFRAAVSLCSRLGMVTPPIHERLRPLYHACIATTKRGGVHQGEKEDNEGGSRLMNRSEFGTFVAFLVRAAVPHLRAAVGLGEEEEREEEEEEDDDEFQLSPVGTLRVTALASYGASTLHGTGPSELCLVHCILCGSWDKAPRWVGGAKLSSGGRCSTQPFQNANPGLIVQCQSCGVRAVGERTGFAC